MNTCRWQTRICLHILWGLLGVRMLFSVAPVQALDHSGVISSDETWTFAAWDLFAYPYNPPS